MRVEASRARLERNSLKTRRLVPSGKMNDDLGSSVSAHWTSKLLLLNALGCLCATVKLFGAETRASMAA